MRYQPRHRHKARQEACCQQRSGRSLLSPYLTSKRNETGRRRRGQRMKRMALLGLVIAGCCIPVLMAAHAAQKMRPPLPKPKPAEIAGPEPEPPASVTSEPEASE